MPWIDVARIDRYRGDRRPQPDRVDGAMPRRANRPFRHPGGRQHFPGIIHYAYGNPMVEELGQERIEAILATAADRLQGEWLLVGGALVALWLEPRRVTEDIDLVSVSDSSDQRYDLMLLAAEAGLSIEAVNSAADFFVRRIPGWQQEIVRYRSGAGAIIYRPTPTLFLLLKIGRLSEQDLADCRALLARARTDRLPLDARRVLAALDSLPETPEPAIPPRREALRRELSAWI